LVAGQGDEEEGFTPRPGSTASGASASRVGPCQQPAECSSKVVHLSSGDVILSLSAGAV
jgi:hypothetical protein